MKLILGFDPGFSGGIAVRTVGRPAMAVYDMPVLEVLRNGKAKREVDRARLSDLLFELTDGVDAAAFVEKVGARPFEAPASSFVFGKGTGVILGVLAAFKIPTDEVPPATWKKVLKVNGGKDGARARASELMPAHAHLWTRKKDDGRAEASLIAYYGEYHG